MSMFWDIFITKIVNLEAVKEKIYTLRYIKICISNDNKNGQIRNLEKKLEK